MTLNEAVYEGKKKFVEELNVFLKSWFIKDGQIQQIRYEYKDFHEYVYIEYVGGFVEKINVRCDSKEDILLEIAKQINGETAEGFCGGGTWRSV